MPLPILQGGREASRDDLIRLFHRTELHWTRHLGEEAALDVGTAFANPQLPNVWNANRVLDAALADGTPPADAMEEVRAHFTAQGTRCAQVVMNPSAPPHRTAPLVEHLTGLGWQTRAFDVLYLAGWPGGSLRETPGLTIIPTRASFRHARELFEEAARPWGEPQVAEAAMSHLDDAHWDALLALKSGRAVGGIGVLAVGEV